jgi:CBS domain-containing protein
MKVSDVMTRDVVTVAPSATLKEAAGLIARHGVSGLPVVDDEGAVLGVLSEADILVKEGGERAKGGLLHWLVEPAEPWTEAKLDARTAGEAMTAPALTIAPTSTVHQAAATMLEEGVNRLPVVEDGKLVGLVTRADLVRAFVRSDEEIRTEIVEDVVQRTLWIEPDTVEVTVSGGAVRLAGLVNSDADAELLVRFVERVPGVVSVDSQVTSRELAR